MSLDLRSLNPSIPDSLDTILMSFTFIAKWMKPKHNGVLGGLALGRAKDVAWCRTGLYRLMLLPPPMKSSLLTSYCPERTWHAHTDAQKQTTGLPDKTRIWHHSQKRKPHNFSTWLVVLIFSIFLGGFWSANVTDEREEKRFLQDRLDWHSSL